MQRRLHCTSLQIPVRKLALCAGNTSLQLGSTRQQYCSDEEWRHLVSAGVQTTKHAGRFNPVVGTL